MTTTPPTQTDQERLAEIEAFWSAVPGGDEMDAADWAINHGEWLIETVKRLQAQLAAQEEVVQAARGVARPGARNFSAMFGPYTTWDVVQLVLDALARLDAARG